MSATKFSAPATRPNRATSHRRRRHTLDRLLLCESLEPRLLLSVDSWMLPTDIQVALPGAPYVAADADGNVYIAAKRADPDVSKYTPDIWLRKYSSDGEVQWTNDLRLPDAQWVYGIAVDSGDDHRVGGVYVAGSFTGTPNLDPAGSAAGQLQPHQGGQDAFLVKYDLENGGFLWAHQWGSNDDRGDRMMDVTVSGNSVFVTGEFGSDMPVMKLNSDGDLQWSRTIQKFERTEGREVVVYESPSAAASIYVGCQSLSQSSEWHTFVAKLSESPDGEDVSLEWMLDVSEYSWVTGLAVGVEDDSVYVGQTNRLAKISATGETLWSRSIAPENHQPLNDVAVDGDVVYAAGRFTEPADFDVGGITPFVTGRGRADAFLARYTADGQFISVQRMGGSANDTWWQMDVVNGKVYTAGTSSSNDGDFPAGLPEECDDGSYVAGMSAFVPTGMVDNVFVMQLDASAPIVNVTDPMITVREGERVTLNATTSAGTIAWYESGVVIGEGSTFEVTLDSGTYQVSAIATDDQGRIGMAGVVVNVINSETYTSTDTPKPMADAHPSKGAGLTTSQITVPSNTSVTAIGTLSVGLNITHTAPSQLKGVLVGPDGTRETLFDRPSALQATYETTLFVGKPLSGTWTLRLEDYVRGTVGTLNSWSITASPQVVQNLPPVANDDSYTVSWNQTLTVAVPGVLANDSDPNGDLLTAELVEGLGPNYGTLSFNGDGSFTYTPEDDFVGIDEFTYEVTDGEFYRAATVSIHVVNRYPIAVNDSYSTAFNTPLVVSKPGVLANDSDPDGDPLTAVLLSGLIDPSSGTLTWVGDGSFTFAPAEGYDGTVSFTYQVTDNGGLVSNVATVTINVAPEEGQELTFSSIDVPKTIADPHPTQGVRPTVSQLVIADTGGTIGSLFRLDLAISHSRLADLSAVVRSPGNIEAMVFPQGTATLPTQWTTDAFAGQPLDGTWQLILRDHVRGTTGTLTAWSITASVESGGGLLTLFGQGDDQSSDKLRGMLASDATLGDHEGFFDDASNTDDAVRMLYDVDDLPDEFLRVGTPDRVATGALDRLMARLDRPAAQPLDEVLEELFPK